MVTFSLCFPESVFHCFCCCFPFCGWQRGGKCSLILPYSRCSSSNKQETLERAAAGERPPLWSDWMRPKAPGPFLFTSNGTILVFEEIKYLTSPLITCMWNNCRWRELCAIVLSWQDHIIFRANLTEDFRGNKNAPYWLLAWRYGI